MIIAIFGHSKVGKTSSASTLSRVLGLPLRSCGNELKRRLATAQIVGDIPDAIHRELDEETFNWALASSRSSHRLVEGRFLHWVLRGLSPPPYLIRLTAEPIVRLGRMSASNNLGINDVLTLDAEDEKFCNRLYLGQPPLQPTVSIDTSDMTVESCVDHISGLVRAILQPT
jgi:cytidylate kinase